MNQLNHPRELMIEQAAHNLRRNLPIFIEQPAHKMHACIVGGAPSLTETLPALRFHASRGHLIFALNGTHDWLVERGLAPNVHVLLDAREKNLEFVRKPRPDVTYFVASQCHPSVFDALSGFDVLMWSAHLPGMQEIADASDKPVILVGGGSTVGLKAMMLAYLWGFRSISMFGMDGCYREDKHHAYAQPMNDGERRFAMASHGQRYTVSEWMRQQAQDFQNDARLLIEQGVTLKAYGSGLLPMLLGEIQKGARHAA